MAINRIEFHYCGYIRSIHAAGNSCTLEQYGNCGWVWKQIMDVAYALHHINCYNPDRKKKDQICPGVFKNDVK